MRLKSNTYNIIKGTIEGQTVKINNLTSELERLDKFNTYLVIHIESLKDDYKDEIRELKNKLDEKRKYCTDIERNKAYDGVEWKDEDNKIYFRKREGYGWSDWIVKYDYTLLAKKTKGSQKKISG